MNRWIARVGIAVAVFLAPWSVLLTYTLPGTAMAQHWSLAWVGLDTFEALFAGLAAICILRRDRRAPLCATVFGALLLTDAWFDVCTSGFGLVAVAEAFFVEIPLSVGAFTYAHLDNKRFESLVSQHVFRDEAHHRSEGRTRAGASAALAHPGIAAERGADDRDGGQRNCRRESRELLVSSAHAR